MAGDAVGHGRTRPRQIGSGGDGLFCRGAPIVKNGTAVYLPLLAAIRSTCFSLSPPYLVDRFINRHGSTVFDLLSITHLCSNVNICIQSLRNI